MLSELVVSSSRVDFTNSNYNYDYTNTNVSSHLCDNLCSINLARMAKNKLISESAGTERESDLKKAKAMEQLTLDLRIIPTQSQICMMCHFSTECENCCNKCSSRCNASQQCGHKEVFGDQAERLSAWLRIIQIPTFRHLKKFVIK